MASREDIARYENNGTSRNGGTDGSFYNNNNNHMGPNGHNGHHGIMAVNNTTPNNEQGIASTNITTINASPPGKFPDFTQFITTQFHTFYLYNK